MKLTNNVVHAIAGDTFVMVNREEYTVDWITNTDEILDHNGWRDVNHHYNVHNNDLTNNSFNYSKQDYIDSAILLPLMLFESLPICPYQDTYDNMFWNHFDCSPPYKQIGITQRSMTNRMKYINLRTINELINHTNTK